MTKAQIPAKKSAQGQNLAPANMFDLYLANVYVMLWLCFIVLPATKYKTQ